MDSTTPEQLKPCPSPWCDHRGFVATTDSDMFYGRAYQVQCTQCAMGGPVKRTEAEAIEAWNQRPAQDSTQEAESELVDRLTGRARFCRDRSEIKTPELLEQAADRITRLEAALREAREAGRALGTEAALLLQDSEGCAQNHYGRDCDQFGMPQWLVDSRERIIANRAALGGSEGQ